MFLNYFYSTFMGFFFAGSEWDMWVNILACPNVQRERKFNQG